MDRPPRLALTDPIRIAARDNKLWKKEQRRAMLYKQRNMYCPCADCGGTEKPIQISEARRHLRLNGRASNCRVYRGPEDNDSSDDEWEAAWHATFSTASNVNSTAPDSGLDVRGAVRDLFQQNSDIVDIEVQIDEITMVALEDSDAILQQNRHGDRIETPSSDTHDVQERPRGPEYEEDGLQIRDSRSLENSMQLLHGRTKITQLGACIMILNLKATHPAMTNALADDIIGTFKQMLPQQNCLPSSLYEVKKVTTQLGLTFDTIDGCPNGYVLYDQDDT